MWLFTRDGVYSVVDKGGRRGQLCVRARDADDLDRLRDRYLPKLSPTITDGGTDYPFRAYAPRRAVAKAVAKVTEDINYSNFKDEVRDNLGWKREGVLHRVWSALLALEPKPAFQPRLPWRFTDDLPRYAPVEPEVEPDDDEPYRRVRCWVCGTDVPLYDGELDPNQDDEELMAEVKKVGEEIAAECEFNDTGSHWGPTVEELVREDLERAG